MGYDVCMWNEKPLLNLPTQRVSMKMAFIVEIGLDIVSRRHLTIWFAVLKQTRGSGLSL